MLGLWPWGRSKDLKGNSTSMKVLVIGANGQLGSDLLRLQRKRPDEIEMVPLSRKELDVSIANTIGTAVSDYHFDVIINCTGYNKVDEAENHATEVFAINAHAPQRMAAVCKARGAMFVHFSTDYVFDGRSRKPYVETDAPSPVNVYRASFCVNIPKGVSLRVWLLFSELPAPAGREATLLRLCCVWLARKARSAWLMTFACLLRAQWMWPRHCFPLSISARRRASITLSTLEMQHGLNSRRKSFIRRESLQELCRLPARNIPHSLPALPTVF